MRQILYKAKSIYREQGRHYRASYKNGDWVYGIVTKTVSDEQYNEFCKSPRFNTRYGYPFEMTDVHGVSGIDVARDTICAFTGMLTKDGAGNVTGYIFENDIVRGPKGDEYLVKYNEEAGAYVLSRDCDRLRLVMPGFPDMFCANYRMSEFQVVGNLYDDYAVEDNQNDDTSPM